MLLMLAGSAINTYLSEWYISIVIDINPHMLPVW